MNIILVGKNHGKSRVLKLGAAQLGVALFLLVVTFAGVAALGAKTYSLWLGESGQRLSQAAVDAWQAELLSQRSQLDQVAQQSRQQMDAITLRMGELQARLMRLDALGQRLTEVAGLGNGEFDFSSSPALGGPVSEELGESYTLPELNETLERIHSQIVDREQQLELIDSLFVNKKLAAESFIAGRPITWGWLSSDYGYRTDPFTGKRAWHAGVDFAGKEDSDIIVVASGVVTFAGDRYGYGNLVEVNHGNGFATRYAHCKELKVSVGAVVEKGQVIATMGSTGRSTGPHVHYEVLKNGKPINPKKYILRASR
ncbi:MAG: M23 family metallopeptidase [Oleiphilaceae bacterium]|nr:M23 family metallopeptidase [Oleiphilaceae bacterium]